MCAFRTWSILMSIVAICMVDSTQVAQGSEWTRFRGPNGQGQSDATSIPIKWSEDDYRWKTPLPGSGHSSPVVWGNRVVVTTADPENGDRMVLCLDSSTGDIQWQKKFAASTHSMHARNSFASSTPAIDAERVYVTWATPDEYIVLALDRQGEVVWRENLGPFRSKHGFGASPIVLDDLVILANDQKDGGSLVALDAKTGQQRWKTNRAAGRAAFATPCVYQGEDGRRQLVFFSDADGMTAVDPVTGDVLWQVKEAFPDRCVGSPAVVDGLILGTCGSGGNGKHLVAVRPPRDASGEAETVYTITRMIPYVPTPIVYGDLVFLWHDRGVVSCIDARTGAAKWQERVGGSFFGSPVRVGDRIYCISNDGEVVVIAAAPQYEMLARNPLGEPSQATPAVADGHMYLRTAKSLICIGGP
jgi:outer membrane protein assembly factor BamB